MKKMKNKSGLMFIVGVSIGLLTSLTFARVEDKCFNEHHDDEYVKELIKDNLMLNRMNQDLLHELQEVEK